MRLVTWASAAVTCTACCIVVAMAAEGAEALQEFTLQEHFGVNHADQVVTFELQKKADPGQCYLLDDAGQEVPFQMVDGGPHGSIAFCMDLPANATRTFILLAGAIEGAGRRESGRGPSRLRRDLQRADWRAGPRSMRR